MIALGIKAISGSDDHVPVSILGQRLYGVELPAYLGPANVFVSHSATAGLAQTLARAVMDQQSRASAAPG